MTRRWGCHEDACAEDTDISLALSAAELFSMSWLNIAASNLEERSCCQCGWSTTTSSIDKASLDITLALEAVSACNRLVLVTKYC